MQNAHKDSWGALRRMQCRGHQGAKFEHKMTQKWVMKLQGCLLSMKIQMGNHPSLLHGWFKKLLLATDGAHDCWSNMRRFGSRCSWLLIKHEEVQCKVVDVLFWCYNTIALGTIVIFIGIFSKAKTLSYFLCILQSDLLHGILQGYWIEELSCRSLLTKGTLQIWIQDWWLMLAYTFKWVSFVLGFISTSSLSLSLSPFSHPPSIMDWHLKVLAFFGCLWFYSTD